MKYLTLAIIIIISQLSGCKTMGGIMVSNQSTHSSNSKHMPSVHERRTTVELHEYYYYPNSAIYFEPSRNIYFYLSGTKWLVSASLPNHYKLDRHRISLKMKSDKPYSHYYSHKKKYPKKHKSKPRKRHKSYGH